MAQKRKSLKKSFRKNNRSTRRKSKTNKRKSKRRGGGDEAGKQLLHKVSQINYLITGDFIHEKPFPAEPIIPNRPTEKFPYIKNELKRLSSESYSSCGTVIFYHGTKDCQDNKRIAYEKLKELTEEAYKQILPTNTEFTVEEKEKIKGDLDAKIKAHRR